MNHPKNVVDKIVNKNNGGAPIYLWKCHYDKTLKVPIPLSKRLNYYNNECQDIKWWSTGSIQRTLARDEIVCDCDTKPLLLKTEKLLRDHNYSFTVWSSMRSGGWIRLTIDKMKWMVSRFERDNYRKAFHTLFGGEYKMENHMCPCSYSIHHKSLNPVIPVRKYKRGILI